MRWGNGSRSRAVAGFAAAGALLALSGCSATTGGPTSDAAAKPAASDEPTAVRSVSPATGSIEGGTKVVIRGQGLTSVRSVDVGGTTVTPVTRSATSLTVVTPASADFDTGAVKLRLQGSSGAVLDSSSFSYAVKSDVDKQMAWVAKYWKHYSPAYQSLPDNDCVDFASQALLARGYEPSGDWTPDKGDIYDSGVAWRGSDAFREYILSNHLGTELTDAKRSEVAVGDIVQFNWEGVDDGDRDHTGTVTRVTHVDGKTKVYFAGHTIDSLFRDVDTTITKDHPGAKVWYLHLKS